MAAKFHLFHPLPYLAAVRSMVYSLAVNSRFTASGVIQTLGETLSDLSVSKGWPVSTKWASIVEARRQLSFQNSKWWIDTQEASFTLNFTPHSSEATVFLSWSPKRRKVGQIWPNLQYFLCPPFFHVHNSGLSSWPTFLYFTFLII